MDRGSLHRSLAPPSTAPERRVNFVGHAVVNAVCALSVTACHLWGELSAELAAGLLAGIAGLWGLNTRRGPPSANAGVVGALGAVLDLFRRGS